MVAGRAAAGPSDLEALIGVPLGPSRWHTVTQDEVDAFAAATGDHNWLHVDPARGRSGPFGGTIAHGLLTLSLGPLLMSELLAFDDFGHSLNYGYDKVRFPAPVPVGDQVRLVATLTDVSPVGPGRCRVTTVQEFRAAHVDKPVCVAESLTYLIAREA